jgi:hypothetical protein
MPAHSGEIIDEIAARFATTRRAQFLGIDFMIEMAGSTSKNPLRNGRTSGARSARGKATHTDPQLLFSVAS